MHSGPLVHGIRYMTDQKKHAKTFGPLPRELVGEAFFALPLPGDAPDFQEASAMEGEVPTIVVVSEAKRVAIDFERERAATARRIKAAVQSLDELEKGAVKEEEEEEVVLPLRESYVCPRYDEIRTYLLGQRGANELALDTMTVLSEPQFYRYIRDRGGIQISAQEFRAFLWTANERHELFM